MGEMKLISADSHVNEPGDLWVDRLDKAFRDRAPRVVENPPGQKPGAYLLLEGTSPVHLAQGMGAGKKPEELPRFFQASSYKDGRPGGWDPAERLKDMDLDGVEADVIYTTLGFRQFWFTDAVFQRACFRVYNDWLAEYCYPAPLTLRPSEYFRRQVYATFIDDPVGVATREFIGVENIMWSSDYPHTVSTWPHSQEVVARDFKDVSETDRRRIVRENVARLYRLAVA
jgi:predicted TIM-barrel fold metal-dependent hydrolase